MRCFEKIYLVLMVSALSLALERTKRSQSKELQDHHGKAFLFSFLEMNSLGGSSRIYVTSSSFGNVTLYVPILNLTTTKPIVPGLTTLFELRPSVRMQGLVKEKKGILLTSNVHVSVYATSSYIFSPVRSRDTFLVYPVAALGKEHVIVTFTPRYKSLIGVIASRNNTLIQITLKLQGNITYNGAVYYNGDILQVFLNQLESFQLEHARDLTGTVIISTQPVAVLSGNACARIPSDTTTCSHLITQVPALSTWGKTFITVWMNKKSWGDLLRIVAAYDNTSVSVVGKYSFTLNANEYQQFQLNKDERRSIVATKPVMLVQFNQGSQGRIHSEAFMVTVPPIEQYTTDYSLVIPLEKQRLTYVSYVDIVLETCSQNSVVFNRSLLKKNFTWRPVPGTDFSIGSSSLKTTLTAKTSIPFSHASKDVRFAAFIFGHKDYDGYGYAGGMGMDEINCDRLFPIQNGKDISNCNSSIGDLDNSEHFKNVFNECDFASVESNFSLTNTNKYFNGVYLKYSVFYGNCENTITVTWFVNSTIGGALKLAVRELKWIKPSLNVSFPADISVDKHNVSVLEKIKPNITSLCSTLNINITYQDFGSVTKGGTIVRQWTVREDCGRIVTGNQTIISTCFEEDYDEEKDSMSEVSITLGISFGILSFLFLLIIILSIWKRHTSRRQVVHIDVLEAAARQTLNYSNPTAMEDCVYAEISIEAPSSPQENNKPK